VAAQQLQVRIGVLPARRPRDNVVDFKMAHLKVNVAKIAVAGLLAETIPQ